VAEPGIQLSHPASKGGCAVGTGELGDRLGIDLISAEPALVAGSMPVAGNTQPFGLLHGGASCVLAESLGSIGACLHFRTIDAEAIGVGTEISASHHRPVSTGLVRGVAVAVFLGRSQATYEISIEDAQGHRVCSARMTCVRTRG
jgi:1,4-dihydroxy-2-naphthoyl-CoA hydrolase